MYFKLHNTFQLLLILSNDILNFQIFRKIIVSLCIEIYIKKKKEEEKKGKKRTSFRRVKIFFVKKKKKKLSHYKSHWIVKNALDALS